MIYESLAVKLTSSVVIIIKQVRRGERPDPARFSVYNSLTVKKIHFHSRTLPLALLVAALLSFAPLITRLGFYWDDWSPVLVNRVFGTAAFWKFYAFDRPSSAWTYVLVTPLLDGHPLAWQIFTLVLRWLTAAAMYWAFTAVWPAARRAIAAAALLFLVYPVFSQQSLSVTYHQLWIEYLLYFLSLGAMAHAVRALRPPVSGKAPNRAAFLTWSLLALTAFGLNFSISEYFIGAELLRPLLIYWILRENEPTARRRLSLTLLHWLPYVVALLFFIYWRLFLVKITGDPNKPYFLYAFLSEPLKSLLNLLQTAARDTLQVLVSGWYKTLAPSLIELARGFSLFAWFIVLLTTAAVALYLYLFDPAGGEDPSPARNWVAPVALTGLAAVLLGPLPAWITGRSLAVAPDPFSDRYAAVAMFGAALLIVAALAWLTPDRLRQVIVLGLLIGLAAGLHIRTANDYRWFWTQQTRFFWQLHWRAPSITPGTALISNKDIFPLQGRFATSAALNLAYPQPSPETSLSYWMISLDPGYTQSTDALKRGVTFDESFRIFKFRAASTDSLVVNYRPEQGECLWVFAPGETYAPGITELLQQAVPLSNLNRIGDQPQPGFPPAEIFGPEPEHTWCYYYEKAALALHQRDWAGLRRLESEARARGYAPGKSGSDVAFEWLPFLEGHARAGDADTAAALSAELSATKRTTRVDTLLCQFWEQMKHEKVAADLLSRVIPPLNCPE